MKGKHVTLPVLQSYKGTKKSVLWKPNEVNILILLVTITSTFEIIPKIDVKKKF